MRSPLAKTIALVSAVLILLGFASPGNASSAMDTVKTAYDPFTVKEFSLDLLPLPGFDSNEEGIAAAWDLIRKDTTNSILVPAVFQVLGDATEYSVEVRRKSSRALPSELDPQKIGLKVSFISPSTWNGISKLSLENGGDISPIAEGLAWNLHQMAEGSDFYGSGYNPGIATWINLKVNGQNLGLYTSVEQRNKQFLRNRGYWPSDATWLYEGDDIGNPVIEAGLPIGSPASEVLCFFPFRSTASACTTPTDAQLAEILPAQIDMNAMLTQAAIDAYTGNNDALVSNGKNYHFIDRSGSPRQYFPWDLDAVFGKGGASNVYASTSTNKKGRLTFSQSGYQNLILNHPDFRRSYNEKISSLFANSGLLSAVNINAFLARVETATSPYLLGDRFVSAVIGSSPATHFAELRTWITARNANVLTQVQQNIPAPRADYPKPPGDSGPVATVITATSVDGSYSGRTGSTLVVGVKLLANSSGVQSKTISLVFNKVSYTSSTNSEGIASFSIKLPSKVGNYSSVFSFAGDAGYLSSTATIPVNVTR